MKADGLRVVTREQHVVRRGLVSDSPQQMVTGLGRDSRVKGTLSTHNPTTALSAIMSASAPESQKVSRRCATETENRGRA